MATRKAAIESIGARGALEEEGPAPRTFESGRGGIAAADSLADLEPQRFSAADGRSGLRVGLPGRRPLATPAILDGLVFLGGGFGSHEFYAFDAVTGGMRWRLGTRDDGPTAAAVDRGLIAFNTESCTVFVVEARSGREVWSRWLGDPLLAQPAMDRSSIYMSYPERRGNHALAALDLLSGKTRWETELVADLVSAPVLAEEALHGVTHDGTLYSIDPRSGERSWSIHNGATSAPWVHGGKVYVSSRDDEPSPGGPTTMEGLHTVLGVTGRLGHARPHARRKAPWLRKESPSARRFYAEHDEKVGFAHAPKSAKLAYAAAHLGSSRVSSLWSFQGSRPQVFDDGIFITLGDTVERLDLETKRPIWRARITFEGQDLLTRPLHPPAVTADRLYLTSGLGDLVVLDRATGEEVWALNVGSGILAPPAVGEGRVVFGTVGGVVYMIEAGDPDPAGWPMWGGGPGHNGPEK